MKSDKTTAIGPRRYNIPAGYPYSFGVKLSRAAADSEDYTDITDVSLIPGEDWALCFVDTSNNALLQLPLDWSQMDAHGYLLLSLSAQQTLALAGRRARLAVRNNAGTSDLMACPAALFYFIPNNLHE